jgi:hypothetical protein
MSMVVSAPRCTSADAAGGEHLDAGYVGNHHGGGHGGGAVCLAGHEHGQVAAAGFGNTRPGLAQILDLLRGAARFQPAVDDADGRRNSAVVTDDLFHGKGGLHILRIRHPVGDDRGLQRHHRLARGKGFGDLRGYIKMLVHFHTHDLLQRILYAAR